MKGRNVMENIYLDHAASTPMHPEVVKVMTACMTKNYGNPSSVHSFGRDSRKIINATRKVIATNLGAEVQEVIFTSGGTESNISAIKSVLEVSAGKGRHIITTPIEHPSVIETINLLSEKGYEVSFLDVDENGFVLVDSLKNQLREDTILVSAMLVNNEIGTIQPIQEMAEVLADHQAYFHVDAVQAFGKIQFNVHELNVDFLSISSHKINGPKGIGALYIKKWTDFRAMFTGGHQERDRRAGTENLVGIAGFGKAVEVYFENAEEYRSNAINFKGIISRELKAVEHWVNTPEEGTVPNVLNVSFPNVNIEALLVNLDLAGVATSSGSACSAGSHDPSHVMTVVFGKTDRAINSVRISFGLNNNEEEVTNAGKTIVKVVENLQEKNE